MHDSTVEKPDDFRNARTACRLAEELQKLVLHPVINRTKQPLISPYDMEPYLFNDINKQFIRLSTISLRLPYWIYYIVETAILDLLYR